MFPPDTNRITLLLSLLVLFSLAVAPSRAQIYINEFQTANIATVLDESGNYHEWIELRNDGSAQINLKGYWLSTDVNNPYQHEVVVNLFIPAGKRALVWIDKDNYEESNRFKPAMEGGELALFSPSGDLLDALSYPEQLPETSYGRYPENTNNWSYFANPTPHEENINPVDGDILPADELIFSVKGGIYQGTLQVELTTRSGEGSIFYTLDGSWPGTGSNPYNGPLLLNATTVVRAFIHREDKLPGPVCTHSYLLNDSSSIPVVSIVTNEEHFFDKTWGFYVKGNNGIIGKCGTNPANYYQDWERPANIEYFTTEGEQVINQMVGLRMIGGCSRKLPNKSIAVFARKKYGDNSLSYKFFNSKGIDNFKALVLRNSSDDATKSMLRDGFMQSTVSGYIDLDLQGYQPASVFLNGEYWGILNVREKVNEHYPASNFQIDADNVDMLERKYYTRPIAGSGDHFIALLNYVKSNDLSEQEHFDYVSTQMDVNEFMNYFLAQIYFANEDWPHNNIKYWHPQVEGGKWRWVVFDTDFGWGLYPRSGNTLVAATTADGDYSVLINALLENAGFRNEFIQRMASLINTAFNPDRVTVLYDSLLSQLNREMPRHQERWGYLDPEEYEFQTEVKIPTFTREHPELVHSQFMDKFNIPGMYTLNIQINENNRGHVRLSGIDVHDGFSGSYFTDIPLHVEAVPASGYIFSHWEGSLTSSCSSLSFEAEATSTIRAVFTVDVAMENIRINEVCSRNTSGIFDEFGQREDWIEIYNGNDYAVNLAGLYISDGNLPENGYRIPYGDTEKTTIEAGSFGILYCDEECRQGANHCDFRLSSSGEKLHLWQRIDEEYILLDTLSYSSLGSDLSYGLQESGYPGYMDPSPLAENTSPAKRNVIISEFLGRNCGFVLDEYGEADDWIELYNPGPDTVDIGGLYISDSLPDPLKYALPHSSASRIPPGSYCLLWADNQVEQGDLHLDFKLDARHEQIGLYQIGIGYLDSLTYDLEESGIAMSRKTSDSKDFVRFSPTPGEANLLSDLGNICINEFMASNFSTVLDSIGDNTDWIEIFNGNDYPIDIGGLYITDSLADRTKHRIPDCAEELTTITPGGFLLLYADNNEDEGALHLDFKLSATGEEIGLFHEDGITPVDTLSFGPMERDMAKGRFGDGSSDIRVVHPTPARANQVIHIENLYISEMSATSNAFYSDEYGEYDDWIEVYNKNDYAIDLGGLYLTDSLGDLTRHYIPRYCPDSTTIPPRSYLVLWADGQEEQGILHLGFKLSGEGEELALVDIDGKRIIDSLSYPDQYRNFSYGRTESPGPWTLMRPSPGAQNIRQVLSGIFINEFMASNSDIPDEYGEYDDWIELYNSNDFAVDVGGLFMSDSIGQLDKHRIPSRCPDSTTIAPGAYLVLWADGQDDQGVLHLDFKLSGDGEELALVDIDGERIIDSLSYPDQYRNLSYGRTESPGSWSLMRPSRGAPNVLQLTSGIYINEYMASNSSIPDEYGEYDDWIELYNSNDFAVDVGGLFLSDSAGKPCKYRIPCRFPDSTTIAPGDYLVFWADGQDDQGILHLDFKLSTEGESILLSDIDGATVLDSLSFQLQNKNSARGYLDVIGEWKYVVPTPGSANYLPDYSALMINEIMSYNRTCYCDEFQEYDDWIELYNSGSVPLDIAGLYFSDSLANPRQYQQPGTCPDSTIINPGEFLVLWADNSREQGILHLGIKLSKTGETIGVFDLNGGLIDSISFPFTSPNHSFGRIEDGAAEWMEFPVPSPMASNKNTTSSFEREINRKFNVYPNPVRSEAVFELSLEQPSSLIIEIIDSQGVILEQFNAIHEGGGVQKIIWNAGVRAPRPAPGLHFIRILSTEGIYTSSFIYRD